ncbi:DUF2793 domain-containing protein [Paenirhodobacter sp.]|uniref:DUF2793 domain-containing protein n=1 Tax=Paenirhodobacter sp. TaxID=1965326 RepID=UPI003B3D0315
MSDTSPILSLPLIMPSQAQKHVTHNEALAMLDVIVQAAVMSKALPNPPSTLTLGDRYLVAAGAGGLWSGQENAIAVWGGESQGWAFHAPKMGWRVYVQDIGAEVVWTGSVWDELGGGGGGTLGANVETLGVSTTANSTNRLAVASAATLLTHAGAGHQLKINKASAASTASLLFQDNWSGRAEMGLAGTDDFEIKVSADGGAFRSALRAAAATGVVSLPQGAVVDGAVTGTAVQARAADATPGRLLAVGAFGLGGNAPAVANISLQDDTIAPGFYGYDVALGSLGGPEGAQTGVVLHQRRSAGCESQMFIVQTSGTPTAPVGSCFTRVRTGAAWSGWVCGSAIATGESGGGRYERHQNGNQTCWQSVTTSTAGEVEVTFPMAFASTTGLVTTVGVVGGAAALPRIAGRTETGLSISAFDTSNARVAVQLDLISFGRWF